MRVIAAGLKLGEATFEDWSPDSVGVRVKIAKLMAREKQVRQNVRRHEERDS